MQSDHFPEGNKASSPGWLSQDKPWDREDNIWEHSGGPLFTSPSKDKLVLGPII